MEWFESYRDQYKYCKENECSFSVEIPNVYVQAPAHHHDIKLSVIVCSIFKTYCNSKACRERRLEPLEFNNENLFCPNCGGIEITQMRCGYRDDIAAYRTDFQCRYCNHLFSETTDDLTLARKQNVL